ncbi:MAG: ribosome-associated translation inhibitor RaiA [Clostridiales bacterium]|nr:ribosome-associated translation inhibitor RaiA [Clostridiales bacterium]
MFAKIYIYKLREVIIMRIEFVEKNYDIGTKLKNLIQKKVDKLDRYFEDDAKARVVCSLQNKIFKLELTIVNKKKIFRAEVVGENMYENIDTALPKIERQIVKTAKRARDLFRQQAFEMPTLEFLPELPEDEEKKIYKTKEFDLSPMPIEEAVENMELLGHEFYVFLNAKSNKVNVLYTRRDGDLGVIECNY